MKNCHSNSAMFVFLTPNILHNLSAALSRLLHQIFQIDDRKCNVLDIIAMLDQTLAEFTVSRVQWGLEDKDNVVLLDDMLDYVSLACF